MDNQEPKRHAGEDEDRQLLNTERRKEVVEREKQGIEQEERHQKQQED